MNKILRPLRFIAAILFILLGVIGLFLPFLQGLLFLAIGGMLLGRDSPPGKWLNRRLQRLTDYLGKRW